MVAKTQYLVDIVVVIVHFEADKCPQQVAAQVPGKGWQRSEAHLIHLLYWPSLYIVGHRASFADQGFSCDQSTLPISTSAT